MKPTQKHKTPEAAERERAHQFGQPGGNKQYKWDSDTGKAARNQREFYKWCESVATRAELEAYARDEANPYARRKFVQALTNCEAVQDFFDLTNQTHGQPKQVVEQVEAPTVIIDLA